MSEIASKAFTKKTELDSLHSTVYPLTVAMSNSWAKIAPFWPLQNLIAVNPAAGFEDLPFKAALKQAKAYFQQEDMPTEMQEINQQSIKWLQAFFDEGQSCIQMPQRQLGFLKSILSLMRFDSGLQAGGTQKQYWFDQVAQKPETLIAEALLYLGIQTHEQEPFLTLILTTLPGWAAHIQYRTNWADAQDSPPSHPITQGEYLAFRLVLTCLIWPEAKKLLTWHQQALNAADIHPQYQSVRNAEHLYQRELLTKLDFPDTHKTKSSATAQLIFCIDVRSEPFRRRIEKQGNYETYGFAGFFGIPIAIENQISGESYASCPVLLKPQHKLAHIKDCSSSSSKHGREIRQGIKHIYQSLKYTFTTPFCLVETIGIASGIWMGLKNISPKIAAGIQSLLKKVIPCDDTLSLDIQSIPVETQASWAAGALKLMGLTDNFSPLVIFCGHGSMTQNNAYATALDCGACAGRHGGPNARILAQILNSSSVRQALSQQEIKIPNDTFFLAAQHNTTTDEITLFNDSAPEPFWTKIESLRQDLKKAQNENSFWRSEKMGIKTNARKANKVTDLRAKDWAELRPEWGLAQNAAFIVAPRWITKDINLDGRAFLHSYEWEKDKDGTLLTTILTAPMVVAQWINAQYFFSTIDNVAFGGGSKTTQNITGKIGIMQGNASDLMHGLPLQSVFTSDTTAYHQPLRLMVIVYAPKSYIDGIINQQALLKKLFKNEWIHLVCFDPIDKQKMQLEKNLTWRILN